MTTSMTPLHSLVEGLRIKNKCHQKEGVTLRSHYLMLRACSLVVNIAPGNRTLPGLVQELDRALGPVGVVMVAGPKKLS